MDICFSIVCFSFFLFTCKAFASGWLGGNHGGMGIGGDSTLLLLATCDLWEIGTALDIMKKSTGQQTQQPPEWWGIAECRNFSPRIKRVQHDDQP